MAIKGGKAKRGRTPLSPERRRSRTLSFRVRDDVYEAIQRAGAAAGRLANTEAQHRIEQLVQIEDAIGDIVDLGDVREFARCVAAFKAALEASGENPGSWNNYRSHVAFMVNLDEPGDLAKLEIDTRHAVDTLLDKAKKFLAEHGAPPTDARKNPPGTPQEVRRELAHNDAMHRFYARKIVEIEGNRARMELEARKQDQDFMRVIRDRSAPGHREAVATMAQLRSTIDRHSQASESDR